MNRHRLGALAIDADDDLLGLEIEHLDALVDRLDTDVERQRLAGRDDPGQVDERPEARAVNAQPEVRRRDIADPAHRAELGEHDRSLSVLQNESQPIPRVCGIERHVSSAGLENAKYAGEHVRRPLRTDTDKHFRAHPALLPVTSNAVGPFVQFPVGKPFVFADQSRGLWRAFHLAFKEVVHAELTAKINGCIVKLVENFSPLRFREQRHLGDTLVRILRKRLQHDLEVLHHALDGGGLKQVGAESE